ncbi:MAG: M36 family metallopeptidase, partial [Bacteroidota bacterium]
AGNFQENNYGRGGRPQDKVNAQALDGGDVGNANFSGPRDGSEGRMQMYRWIVGNNVEIVSPAVLAGEYATGNASFGPTTFDDVVGTIAIVDDGIGESTDACDPIQNGALINGSIALIDRGTCDFSFKVFAAQEAGALAAIVCNNQDDAPLVNMAAGQNAALVTIPSVFLSKEDCSVIREAIVPPTTVTLRIQSATELASSLDNGIVAHENRHVISLRLAGGANTSGCLSNDEQVGEGWSDFIGLVLTHEPDANPRSPRGIGTYVLGQHPSGSGIRRYRYSTDMAINPQTHSHIRASSRPHPVGEVWASALWDMYWELIDIYGYD